MDLEDQLRGDAAGAGSARLTERLNEMAPKRSLMERRSMMSGDPYGELKTRVQRACIAKLGPRLFGGSMASERPAQAGHRRGHARARPGDGDAARRRATATG